MIVDTHMHIGRPDLIDPAMVDFLKGKGIWEKIQSRLTPANVVETLDQAQIDIGVVFPLSFQAVGRAWQSLNDLTASYAEAHPKRLVGLAVINPASPDESVRELERAIGELGLRGVKIHPSMQEFYPNDAALDPIWEFAQAHDVPVLCHTGASAPAHSDIFSRPMLLDEVAVKFPRLRLILAHAGRPFYAEAALLLRKHPNVYVDLSANVGRRDGEALLAFVLLFLQVYAGVPERVLFASDYPVFSPKEFRIQLEQAAQSPIAERLGLTPVTELELRGILGGNAVGCFNLESGGR